MKTFFCAGGVVLLLFGILVMPPLSILGIIMIIVSLFIRSDRPSRPYSDEGLIAKYIGIAFIALIVLFAMLKG